MLRNKVERLLRSPLVGAPLKTAGLEIEDRLGAEANRHDAAAIEQKVQALAGRAEPQARDVFDLHLLFARNDAGELPAPKRLSQAIDNALGISFDEHRSKAVAYLDREQAELYEERDAGKPCKRPSSRSSRRSRRPTSPTRGC